jgi:hypothetical protein
MKLLGKKRCWIFFFGIDENFFSLDSEKRNEQQDEEK